MSNVYSALLDMLQRPEEPSGAIFGTLAAVSPLTIRVGDTDISQNLFYPSGTVFYPEHIGRTLALLPCEAGFLILFQTEGVS